MKKIFISYSHKDVEFKDMLVEQLRVLELERYCDLWVDDRIQTGTDWLPAIQTAIEEADIAVLMVSAGFLTSNFIRGKEVPPILQRREKQGLTVLPIFVKPCPWKQVPWLSCIQGFPLDDKSLMEYPKPKRLNLLKKFAENIYHIMNPSSEEPERVKDMGSRPSPANKTPRSGAQRSGASPANENPRSGATLLTALPHRKIKLIGREKDLAALAEMLKKAERVVLVNGLGGIGKTEVCKSFFFNHYNQYQYAAWIDWISTFRESLVNALGGDKSTFIQAAEKDTIDDRFDKIMARLQCMRESFLLVADNIENPGDADLDALASLPAQVKVLVNSRNYIEGYEVRNLDYLSPAECRALFYEFYKGKPDNADDEAVDRVVELCGYHTLTVELLAKTAVHAGMGIAKLYDTLKKKGFNLNKVDGVGNEKVPTVWHNEKEKKRFFDHLVKVFDIACVTKKELSILVNLSVLPAVYIRMEWVREWLQLKDNNAVASLVEKGWLKRDGVGEETRLYLHPVMQEVVRYRARPDAKKCKTLIISLANKLYLAPEDNPILKKEYIPYGEAVVRALAMEMEEKDEALATLANNLSLRHRDMGQLDRALEFQLKANDIYEAVLDDHHPLRATSYNNVSTIYKDMGQLERALEFQLKTVDIFEEVLDKTHPDLAMSYNNLSVTYRDMGQLDRAMEFQLKALDIREMVLANNHPSLALSYNNVSTIYQSMGQLDRAMEFQLKALAIREAVLAKNHPDLATSYSNVSLIYRDMGQLERALEFQSKALAIREAVLDKNHPDLAQSHHNLSTIYRDMKNHTSALAYAEKAVAIMQLNFPNGHPKLDVMKRNLEEIKKVRG
jgi:tetratricopeptide (TPR) repeat protein